MLSSKYPIWLKIKKISIYLENTRRWLENRNFVCLDVILFIYVFRFTILQFDRKTRKMYVSIEDIPFRIEFVSFRYRKI